LARGAFRRIGGRIFSRAVAAESVECGPGNVFVYVMVLDHPFAAASLVIFLIATSHYSEMPTAARQLFQILLLAPTIILTRPVAGARLAPRLYVLVLFFTIDILTDFKERTHPARGALAERF
jgi:hypothetical protein